MSRRGGRSKKRGAGQGAPAPLPRGLRTGLVVARLWAGAFFLVTAWWKLVQDGYTIGEKIGYFREDYVAMIQGAIARPPELFGAPLTLYADFLETVMLPAERVLAPAILFFELLLGLSLVLGLGVRLTSSLGVLLMLGFNLAKPMPSPPAAPDDPVGVYLFTVRTANWPVTLLLLLLALAAAGRILGLDAWLRARGPRGLRWIG